MPLFSRLLGAWVDPADVFVTLYSNDEQSFWLDREAHPSHAFSVMGHASATAVLDAAELLANFESPMIDLVQSEPDQTDLPFAWRPGYVGWFDYQSLESDSITGTWLRASEAVVFDHRARVLWLVGDFTSEAFFTEWVNAALIRLGLSGGQRIGYLHRNGGKGATLVSIQHQSEAYNRLVVRAKQHIAAGDVYQLCLTNRLEYTHSLNPLEVFLRLRDQNPAPYSTYIRVGAKAIVCASPEQFLTIDQSLTAVTRPIKGTRARFANPEHDDWSARELADHPKERAENLMIVDLMRNDLGRVSQPDSVNVDELFAVEAHPTVHQLVSTVTAQIRGDVTVREIIGAVFPGGSMTGAPKFRAMELINQLEGVHRGTYSGVLGYISSDGRLDLGMTIRTLIFDGETVSLGVGGGITIDSDPEAEVAETALKAEALLRVIGATSPWA